MAARARALFTLIGAFSVVLGAQIAAAVYLIIAVDDRTIVSLHAAALAYLLAVSGIVSFAIALNLQNMRALTLAISIFFGTVCLLFLFLLGFAIALSDWVETSMMLLFALFVFPGVVVYLVRYPGQMITTLASAGVFLFAFVAIVQVMTSLALERVVLSTYSRGGCVITGTNNPPLQQARKVASAAEIRRGWFIGPGLEPVYLVFGDHFERWSFSLFGVESKNGAPIAYPLFADLKC